MLCDGTWETGGNDGEGVLHHGFLDGEINPWVWKQCGGQTLCSVKVACGDHARNSTALQNGIQVGRTSRLSGGKKSREVDIQDAACMGIPRSSGISNWAWRSCKFTAFGNLKKTPPKKVRLLVLCWGSRWDWGHSNGNCRKLMHSGLLHSITIEIDKLERVQEKKRSNKRAWRIDLQEKTERAEYR